MFSLKEGNNVAFENNLRALKLLDPDQSNSKQKPLFVENQDVVEQLTIAKLAIIERPEVVETAMRMFPLKDYIDPLASWLGFNESM